MSENKENWNMKLIQNVSDALGKGTGRIENQRKNGDHPDYSIIEIDQNTQKSSVDFWLWLYDFPVYD